MGLFKKRKTEQIDRVEQRFQRVVQLVKDLDPKEYRRLVESMELVWRGYQKMYQATPQEEKDLDEIDNLEKSLIKVKEDK